MGQLLLNCPVTIVEWKGGEFLKSVLGVCLRVMEEGKEVEIIREAILLMKILFELGDTKGGVRMEENMRPERCKVVWGRIGGVVENFVGGLRAGVLRCCVMGTVGVYLEEVMDPIGGLLNSVLLRGGWNRTREIEEVIGKVLVEREEGRRLGNEVKDLLVRFCARVHEKQQMGSLFQSLVMDFCRDVWSLVDGAGGGIAVGGGQGLISLAEKYLK